MDMIAHVSASNHGSAEAQFDPDGDSNPLFGHTDSQHGNARPNPGRGVSRIEIQHRRDL